MDPLRMHLHLHRHLHLCHLTPLVAPMQIHPQVNPPEDLPAVLTPHFPTNRRHRCLEAYPLLVLLQRPMGCRTIHLVHLIEIKNGSQKTKE